MARVLPPIVVAAVGKLRAGHWIAAQEEYMKRLRRYGAVRLVEVKDAVGKGAPAPVAVQREGEALAKAAEGAGTRVALARDGRAMTSEGFAEFLKEQALRGRSAAFLIGGPEGLSDEALGVCGLRMSLSAMTFPHELARAVLLEQLYRAATILSGEKYHK